MNFRLQEVPHVHFHVIPKPSATEEEGLVIGWPVQTMEMEELVKVFEEMKGRLENLPTEPAL